MNLTIEQTNNIVNKVVKMINITKYKNIYGIPKNGLIIASMISNKLGVPIVDKKDIQKNNTLIVDDILDSGNTILKYQEKADCLVIFSKKKKLPDGVLYCYKFVKKDEWVSWFWEEDIQDKEEVVRRQIQQIGEDCNREGLLDTPARVIRSYDKLYGGYKQRPEDVLKTTFSCEYDEIILLRDIPLYSTCEHHLLPFVGKCHIGYIPGECGKVIGVSKLARLMEVFARRMQIQEKLTMQIGTALVKSLKPKAVGVIIQASHMCMTARGVEKPGSSMVTSYMYGAFKTEASAREELLRLIQL